MSFLTELFLEIFVEGIFELVGYCYIKLMTLIVPDKKISDTAKEKIKSAIKIVAGILAIVLVIGLILLVQEKPFIKTIGKYMTYIPLTIIVLQIILGITVKIIDYFKK